MSEASASGDWISEWKELQSRFWEWFRRLAAAQSGNGEGEAQPAPGLPWHEGLELWTRLFRPRESTEATVEHALARARQFLSWMQRAAEKAARHEGVLPSGEELAELMRDFAQSVLPDPFAWFSGWTVDRMRELEKLWQPAVTLAESLWASQRADLERLLAIQPFGLFREHQERRQAIAQAVMALVDAEANYRALLARAWQRGIERFEEKLAARGENANPVRSVRELFDLWIDAGEEGFLEVASAAEFRSVYGRLVNAQFRLRQLLQREVELACRALGMPTRSELDGVLRKLKELRVRQADLEARIAALEAASADANASASPAPTRRASRTSATAQRRSSARRRET